jgi:hypothetical protein
MIFSPLTARYKDFGVVVLAAAEKRFNSMAHFVATTHATVVKQNSDRWPRVMNFDTLPTINAKFDRLRRGLAETRAPDQLRIKLL